MECMIGKELAVSLLLISLFHGVSGIAECDVAVPCACCLDGTCHAGTLICSGEDCKNGYWGAQCNNSCPHQCVSCHRNFGIEWLCFECVPGYFGRACSINCSSVCQVCNKETGKCEECSAGYYGADCDKRCSVGCKNSTCHKDTGKCIECEVGYFGEENCDMACAKNCKNNACHIQTGICPACKDGFYGNFCNTSCSQKCEDETCTQSNGNCITCVIGYYGTFCNEVCPANCMWNACVKESGQCYACKTGYFGANCSEQCPIMCKDNICNNWDGVCINGCSPGFKGDRCDDCIDGKYGDVCAQNCSIHCVNSECYGTNGSCKYGCEPEYSDMTFCCANNRNCEKCSSYTECTSCIKGTYGPYCELMCSEKCVSGCDKATGHCLQCNINYYGPHCQHICSEHCVSHNDTSQLCDQNGHCLLDCDVGNYGNKCDLSCSSTCREMCDRHTGVCDSCKGNTHGNFCQHDCPTSCFQNNDTVATCYRVNGTCMFGCQPHYFGNACESKCSVSCNESCDGQSGQCFGCLMNKYGSQCEKTCSDGCVQGSNGTQTCSQTSGFCSLGCRKGFSGETCSSDSDGVSTLTVAISAVVAAVLVMIVILAIMTVVRKRDTCRKIIERASFKYYTSDANMTRTTEFKCTCVVRDEFEDGELIATSTQHKKESKKGEPVTVSRQPDVETAFNSAYVEKEKDLQAAEQLTVSTQLDEKTGFNGTGTVEDKGRDGVESVAMSTQLDEETVLNGAENEIEKTLKEAEPVSVSRQPDVETVFSSADEEKEKDSQAAEQVTVLTQLDENTGLSGTDNDEENEFEGVESVAMSTQLDEETVFNSAINEEEKEWKEAKPFTISTQLNEKTQLNGTDANEGKNLKGEEHVTLSTRSDEETAFNGANVEEEKLREREPAAMSKRLDEGVGFNGVDVEEDDFEEGEPITFTKDLDEESSPYYSNAERLNTMIPKTNLRMILAKSDESYKEEFQLLLPNGLTKPTTEAQKPSNAHRNRYKWVYPYDDSRVKIKDADSDYINACYIDGFRTKRAYIAAQGPTIKQLGKDFKAFWQMVWQEKVETIVMVTKLHETSGMKCDKYWPDLGSSSSYAGFSVECVKEEQFAELTLRSLNISKNEEKRRINHVNFTAWPDKATPDDVISLVNLRHTVVNMEKRFDGPLLVHCSAGIGRTGTFIALDFLANQGATEDDVYVFDCVFNMRNQRVNMVQTLEQYKFLHHAVLWTLTPDIEPLPADRFMDLSWLSDHKLNEMFEQLQMDHFYDTKIEQRANSENKDMAFCNRQGADIPGHKHAVTLLVKERSTMSQYINAVYLDSYKKQKRFIAAMTPLPETRTQFLSMIIQEDVTCIVDLTPRDYNKDLTTTNSTANTDIGEYLPLENQDVELDQQLFKLSHSENHGCFMKSVITVTDNTKSAVQGCRTIHHFCFTKWNASATLPDNADDFVKLINEIEATTTNTEAFGPIAVHCLSGAERSGLFCAVWLLIERMTIDREVSVVNTLRQVKTRRRMAIPSSGQIRFCFECLASHLNNRHSHVYSNIEIRL